MEIRTDDTEATLALGHRLAAAILAAQVDQLVIDLEGDLGAGKTVLVRGLARGLGVPGRIPVVSPTFTIARSYELQGPALTELHHLDAYRLFGADELEAVGYEEMCGAGRLTCVEWGSHVVGALPEDRLTVQLAPQLSGPEAVLRGGELPRRIVLAAHGPRSARVLEAWPDAPSDPAAP